MSEFTINSYIPVSSSKKLLANAEDVKFPKKVILVVIDSLRYDYIDKFPFVSATLSSEPEKSFILKCKVGNPTMTTQRI
jgi:predicted AlkP superfamily pyrophosphatase or phosphodiesterase